MEKKRVFCITRDYAFCRSLLRRQFGNNKFAPNKLFIGRVDYVLPPEYANVFFFGILDDIIVNTS